MSRSELRRLIPNGHCWCGCGAEVSLGKFFLTGHDKIAEAALVATRYDASVARLLHEHGYGPDNSVRAAAVAAGHWETCPRGACDYTGAPESVANHVRKVHPLAPR